MKPRVLVWLRPNAPVDRGGDWLHFQATLTPLLDLGLQVDYSVEPGPNLDAYDVCLIWNTVVPEAPLRYYFHARKQGKPIVIMPIHWSLQRFVEAKPEWRDPGTDHIPPGMADLHHQLYLTSEKILMQGADCLLPMSTGEAESLANDLGASREKTRIAHYGVDPLYARGDAARFRERFGVGDFVLCAGYIGPRKNQWNLIRALRDDPHPLVFLGDVEMPEYNAACQAEAAKRTRAPVHFFPRQDHATVADAFAAARAHAVISWYDVGPLVALEAALAGCPQAVTTECGMRDYFGDEAYYADPADLEGIRRAVETACAQPRASALAERVQREFTWERSAREIASALEWTLSQSRAIPDLYEHFQHANALSESKVHLLWRALDEQERLVKELEQVLEAQTQAMRALESWAHDLNRQLLARRSFRARLGALIRGT